MHQCVILGLIICIKEFVAHPFKDNKLTLKYLFEKHFGDLFFSPFYQKCVTVLWGGVTDFNN